MGAFFYYLNRERKIGKREHEIRAKQYALIEREYEKTQRRQKPKR